LFVSFVQLANNLSHTFLHASSHFLPNPQPLLTMPPKSTVAPSRVTTRAKNRDTHPGIPDRAPARRSSVEVENERAAKARAKETRQDKYRQAIRHAAEFEKADMVNEDRVDATPRACFTPPARNCENAVLGPVAEVSDDSDTCSNSLSYQPLDSEESVTGKESADESDESDPRPLAKKLKAHTTGKAISKVGRESPAKKTRKTAPRVVEAAPNEKTPKKTKPKPKLREQIDMAGKEMDEVRTRKKGGDMAKLTSGQPAGEERSGTPPLPPSEVQPPSVWQWGRQLKRMGAVADLSSQIRQGQQSEDQSSSTKVTKRMQPDDNNPIRQVIP
jgi:hypothetical protein